MTQKNKRSFSFFLVILLVISMIMPFAGTGKKVFASETESTYAISSGALTVLVDPNFPRVIEYNCNGKTMYGQEDTLSIVKINDTEYTPDVTSIKQDDSILYTLLFENIDVLIVVEFKVNANILEMKIKDIQENGSTKVFSLEFPYHNLVSVRSTQPGAGMAYNKNYISGDVFSTVNDKAIDSAPVRSGYTIIYTNELAATIETSLGGYYNKIQTVQKDGYKRTGIWSDYYQYRGTNADQTIMELPWTRVTVVEDQNGDGQIDWQDGAIAFRSIMDELPGQNRELAKKSTTANIICNYWGRMPWTWEMSLDYLKRQALATDMFPQILLAKSAHNGVDGDPSYGDANPLLGGNENYRWFQAECLKWNIYPGTHTSQNEAYPESKFWEGTPLTNVIAWDQIDREGFRINQLEYWNNDLLGQRYDLNAIEWPDNQFLYIDVDIACNGTENAQKFMVFKTISKLKEHNWTFFTEFETPTAVIDIPFPGVPYRGIQDIGSKYITWSHSSTYAGNSNIRRFIMNSYITFRNSTPEYTNLLGRSYGSYGYLGWWNFGTLDQEISDFWRHTLPDTYLKNFDLLKIFNDPDNNNYLTAILSDGVKSVYDGTYRNIYRNGIQYAKLSSSYQEIFIPYTPKGETKIYTFKSTSGEKTWTLPASWNGITTVQLYKLDETKGRVFVEEIPVVDNKITISYIANQGYVVTKTKEDSPPVIWGEGSLIKDMEFNSNSFDYWKPSNPENAFIIRDSQSNFYLELRGTEEISVSQQFSGLEPGKSYTVTAQAYHRYVEGKKASLKISGFDGDKEVVSTTTGYNVAAVYDRLNNWTTLQVFFTASESGTATITLTGLASTNPESAVCFDNIRIWPEENRYGKNGHYFYEDFEDTHITGPFVHAKNGVSSTLTMANPPYTKDVISGNHSLKTLNVAMGTNIQTLPSTLKLQPNTQYTLSFAYKPMYADAIGWSVDIFSQSTKNILAKAELSGAAWRTAKQVLTFTTDSAEDYVIRFNNDTLSLADLVIDDITVDEGPFVQEIPIDEAFPDDGGTVMIYAHQDDDLIWMLPFWEKVDKFVIGALPTSPIFKEFIRQQEEFINSTEYAGKIVYEANWEAPWGEITDEQYSQYYWKNNAAYRPGEQYLLSRWSVVDETTMAQEAAKIKEKIRPYFIDENNKRFITHNIWGEYGHVHHIALNRAVRELAVEYGKDVYMLGHRATNDGIFPQEEKIPSDVRYTTGSFDAALYEGIRDIYLRLFIDEDDIWTWGDSVPTGPYKYPKIVDNGIDMEQKYNPTSGLIPDENGVYTFDGFNFVKFKGTKSTSFTIAMSIKPDRAQNMAISTIEEIGDYNIQDRDIRIDADGRIRARAFDGRDRREKVLVSSSVIPTDKWTHIVYSGDGTNLYLYINGKLEAQMQGQGYTGYATDTNLIVGRVVKNLYEGKVGDIELHEYYATEAMAREMYKRSLAYENEIYVFDGETPGVKLPGTKSKQFTISMSINPALIQDMAVFTIEQIDTPNIQDRDVRLLEDGRLIAMVYDAVARRQKKMTSQTAIAANEWTNIILTGDGSVVKLYINGVLDCSLEGEAYAGYQSDVQLSVGEIYNVGVDIKKFNGQIGDVQLIEKAITDEEALVIYQNSLAKTIPATIVEILPIDDITVIKGSKIEQLGLPSVVTAVYSDNTRMQVPVQWNTEGLDLNTAGTYNLEGHVEGTEIKAVVKIIVIEEPSEGKPFTIVSTGVLDRSAGIKAVANIELTPGVDTHAGNEVVVFQLMKGDMPISIVAVEKDIVSREILTAHFNVTDPQNTSYKVKVFVFDEFNSDLTVPISLAVPVILE